MTKTVVDHITSIGDLDALEADWRRLAECHPNAGFFNSWHWNRLWWQHYGNVGELSVLVVRIDGVVEGIAPLYLLQTRALKLWRVPTLRFMGSGGDTSPDDLDVLFNPSYQILVIQRLCEYILQHPSVRRIQLSDMPRHSAFKQALLAMASGMNWSSGVIQEQKRRVGPLPQDIDTYEKSLSRNARKHRRRRRLRLFEAGSAEFMRCTTPEQVNQAFHELGTLHRNRQAGKGASGSFNSTAYNDFHHALMHRTLGRGELRLIALTLDGHTVGIEYAFMFKGVLSFFQTGFDHQFQHLSPGHLLMMHLIDEAIVEGAHAIDMLKGEYAYKSSYARQWQITESIDLWRNGFMASAQRLLRQCRSSNQRQPSVNNPDDNRCTTA